MSNGFMTHLDFATQCASEWFVQRKAAWMPLFVANHHDPSRRRFTQKVEVCGLVYRSAVSVVWVSETQYVFFVGIEFQPLEGLSDEE